jgi:hypothetical protein
MTNRGWHRNKPSIQMPVEWQYSEIGIPGILLRAKSPGLFPAVKPIMDALRQDAGFWLSQALQKQVLAAAGEKP